MGGAPPQTKGEDLESRKKFLSDTNHGDLSNFSQSI